MLGVRWWHERHRQRRRRRRGRRPSAAIGVLGSRRVAAPGLQLGGDRESADSHPGHGAAAPAALPPPPPQAARTRRRRRPRHAPAAEPATKVGFPSPGWRGGTSSRCRAAGCGSRTCRPRCPATGSMLAAGLHARSSSASAVWGAVVATVLRPMLAAGAVSYAVVAVPLLQLLAPPRLPLPDRRLRLPPHARGRGHDRHARPGAAALEAARSPSWRAVWRPSLAAAFFVGAATFTRGSRARVARAAVFLVVTLIAGVAAVVAAILPNRRVAAPGRTRPDAGAVWCKVPECSRHRRQRAARRSSARRCSRRAPTCRRSSSPNAVVITTEDVGRPAENIEYYSGVADALYMTDLERWQLRRAHDRRCG